MHELGIAEEVIRILSERVGGALVKRVVLEVGVLSAVLPDALRFCFDLAAQNTPAEGAVLEIVEKEGRARCQSCDEQLSLRQPFGRCTCGSTDLEWLSGDELKIQALEVV